MRDFTVSDRAGIAGTVNTEDIEREPPMIIRKTTRDSKTSGARRGEALADPWCDAAIRTSSSMAGWDGGTCLNNRPQKAALRRSTNTASRSNADVQTVVLGN